MNVSIFLSNPKPAPGYLIHSYPWSRSSSAPCPAGFHLGILQDGRLMEGQANPQQQVAEVEEEPDLAWAVEEEEPCLAWAVEEAAA